MFCVYVCIYVVYGGRGVGGVYVTGLGSFLPLLLFLLVCCIHMYFMYQVLY